MSAGHGTGPSDPDDRDALVHPTRPPFDREIRVRPIATFLAGLTVVVVSVSILLLVYVRHFRTSEAARDVPPSPLVDPAHPRRPPLPHLQVTPEKDLAAMRAAEDSILRGWGWVDARAGVARIPIERAMQILAQRGLPEVGAGTPVGGTAVVSGSAVTSVPALPVPEPPPVGTPSKP